MRGFDPVGRKYPFVTHASTVRLSAWAPCPGCFAGLPALYSESRPPHA
jgi:hypothetical protein